MNFEPTDQDIVVNADELRAICQSIVSKGGRAESGC